MSFKQSPDSVIIAENNSVARASLADLLSLDGYRVFQADNVKAALFCINRVDDLKVLLADFIVDLDLCVIYHAHAAKEK
jgi:DNA-binding NtrC family response regulator